MNNVTMASDQKVIYLFIPRGVGKKVGEALIAEHNLATWYVSYARGKTLTRQVVRHGVGEWIRKEILTVMVPADRADEFFHFIYQKAEINRPHGGFMCMANAGTAIPFVMPDIDVAGV